MTYRIGLITRALFASLVTMALMLGPLVTPAFAQQQTRECDYLSLIQNAGLDIQKSAPAVGCRQDERGQWWMPTIGTLADDPAYQDLNPLGQDILAAVDRMSMDHAFDLSVRYDRTRAVALTLGPYSKVYEKDISDAELFDAPTWTHDHWDGYEQAMMTYLTRTQGDEDELVQYMNWFVSRRDITIPILTSNMNPMLANAQRYNWGYQRAPWPWQLADPFAIAEYTGQDAASLTENSSDQPQEGNVAQNLDAWLDVSPRLLRVSPGGSALYVVQTVLWGDWSTSQANDFKLEIHLPAGVHVQGDPQCRLPVQATPYPDSCDPRVEAQEDGGTHIVLHANLADGLINGLDLPLRFDPGIDAGTMLSLQAFFRISGGGPIGSMGAGDSQKVQALVIDSSELMPLTDSSAIAGRIELTDNFSALGETCTPTFGASDLVLYEWGDTTVLSRSPYPTGRMGATSDGTERSACIIPSSSRRYPQSRFINLQSLRRGKRLHVEHASLE